MYLVMHRSNMVQTLSLKNEVWPLYTSWGVQGSSRQEKGTYTRQSHRLVHSVCLKKGIRTCQLIQTIGKDILDLERGTLEMEYN